MEIWFDKFGRCLYWYEYTVWGKSDVTVYFESRTNNGVLQISDNTPLIYLHSKTKLSSYYIKTQTAAYSINNGSYGTHDVHIYSLPITDNLMYIGSPIDGTAHVFSTHVGYIYNWYNANPSQSLGKKNVLGVANVGKDIADNMVLYTFTQGNAPNTNIGLECYDENGNRVYSTLCKTMKLLTTNIFTHCAYGNDWDGSYQDLNTTHSYSGKSIAYNCSKSGYYHWRIPVGYRGPSLGRFPVCLLSTGKAQMATVTSHNFDSYPKNGSDTYLWAVAYECMASNNQTMYSIVDVTNY